ncbi:MAG: class I SAM-dependent methyltransferase [Candidatus Cohnella colombiensis]|uniref:Class I SAM-dependent methyltransferase n=1 Tax=Candidatus Cohnella colombiensis TaxID=3121368 RepID=A0AA95EYU5_9BACL|nr:MAG: class I SAM-dependent methyltransferase [Cohnella sp.]
MTQWTELNDESRVRWETIAEFWDDYMGDESNRFHRELIRSQTEQLLQIQQGHIVLDIGCGNGNFTRRLSDLGANVVAFDYSSKMIERAKLRTKDKLNIRYKVLDATNPIALSELGKDKFDRAVSNMALMDISDVGPLITNLHTLLKRNGTVVFSIPHPCFQTPNMREIQETEDLNGSLITRNSIQIFDYLTPEPYQAIGIRGQSVEHYMFHRPLEYYFKQFFTSGFVLDGFLEPSFIKEKDEAKFDWYDIPPVCIFRFKKV